MPTYFLRGFDSYTIQARMQPAFSLAVPFGMFFIALVPDGSLLVGLLLGIMGALGGAALLAQVTRDLGSKKQSGLWASWGGAPTTDLLRFRSSSDDAVRGARRQKFAEVTRHKLPTEEEEGEDPVAADERYADAVAVLRSKTYDIAAFPLVHAENCNYGFRRNLWSMKRWGLSISIIFAVCCWGLVIVTVWPLITGVWDIFVIADPNLALVVRLFGAVFNSAIVALWLFLISPSWVRVTAETYAKQLFGALDNFDDAITGDGRHYHE